jgi:hypothetical protein
MIDSRITHELLMIMRTITEARKFKYDHAHTYTYNTDIYYKCGSHTCMCTYVPVHIQRNRGMYRNVGTNAYDRIFICICMYKYSQRALTNITAIKRIGGKRLRQPASVEVGSKVKKDNTPKKEVPQPES